MGIGEIGESHRRSTVHVRSGRSGSGSGVIRDAIGHASRAIAASAPIVRSGDLGTGVIHAVGPVHGMGGQEFIQTPIRLTPGNPGGPVADADGSVIGINTANVPGGLGLAIPGAAVGRLPIGNRSVELGVTIRPVRILALHGGIALIVLVIAPGSPADYASPRPGDLLTVAGGQRFGCVDDLHESATRGSAR